MDWTTQPGTLGPAVLTAVFLVALAAFAVKSALFGRPQTPRVEKAGGSILLSKYLMEYGLWVFGPLTRTAIRLEIHPDVFSWASLGLHGIAALLIAQGRFFLGAWILVFGAFCDALDGAVARARGIASDAGEVLDAAIDRWAEMAVFFGFAWYYRDIYWGFLLAVGACAGAVMVSYSRAKAESFGVDAALGLMQRHERAVWLAVATLGSSIWELWRPTPPGEFAFHTPVLVALGVIAVLSNWTGWLRTRYTREELRKR
ncbi:MAG TPA: CDP-alcohol phosphatidyltransferase family protein [Anaeromyxobacteraceae bacterium]|nr:CDP-alcohol phosphatidyltransferase family protein [Anaeromyxobacteraceae bacterium]